MKQNSVTEQALEYSRGHRRHRRWQKVVSCLGAAVVFCTTYALMLPAITLEARQCTLTEHTHISYCYTQLTSVTETEPVCSSDTLDIHQHSDECYADGRLTCGLADFVVHRHDSSCRIDGELWCDLPVIRLHEHDDDCYTLVTPEQEDFSFDSEGDDLSVDSGDYALEDEDVSLPDAEPEWELTCDEEELSLHIHDADCYREDGSLLCRKLEIREHVHSEDCFLVREVPVDTESLTCGLEEGEEHTHDEMCYGTWELSCTFREHTHTEECFPEASLLPGTGEAEAEDYLCGLPAHAHEEGCYDAEGQLTCTLAEHDHTGECLPLEEELPEYSCGITDHTHTSACRDEAGELVCGLEEHDHTELCLALTEEELAQVDSVIAMIDELPSANEVDAALLAYEEAEDWEGYDAYFADLAQRCQVTYAHYQELSEPQRARVTNADRLLDLEWLWSARTLELTDTIFINQVNYYNTQNIVPILVYGDTVANATGVNDDFFWWYAVIVEENDYGQLYVDRILPDGATQSKRECRANSANGFVLLIWSGDTSYSPPTMKVGNLVETNFQYKDVSGYRDAGYGNLYFRTDNSDELNIVASADTSEMIEVNLYDYLYYDSTYHINANYDANSALPGFQQDSGTLTVYSTASSNFGNNITTDLAAGHSSITLRDNANHINGVVNKIAGNDTDYGYANVPVPGNMLPVMVTENGVDYPALKDGTSLSWLWKDNGTYVRKQNSSSINGLFRHNPVTGAYTFNSRENHAQFNPENDTFTLYDQVISSNYAWYPFGNFLPFNDILTQTKQASQIDRAYLVDIAKQAYAKYYNGCGDEYLTLYESMNTWIGKMDAEYGTDWDSADAANAYFNSSLGPGAGDNPDFDFHQMSEIMNKVYSIDFDEATNFFFGMEAKMRFIQPKDGMTGTDRDGDGESDYPMVFYFTGDDDVWVYIDGVLFLDLSGIHRHVGGEIDFVNGVVNYYPLEPAPPGDVTQTPCRTVTFAEILQAAGADTSALNAKGTFKNYTPHDFDFYYMERGAGSGVCRLNFNFPLIRKNSITVSKQNVPDSANVDLLGSPDYFFNILTADNRLFIGPGSATGITAYKVMDSSGSYVKDAHGDDQIFQTDPYGIFTLKAGQTAVFEDIPENSGLYYVQELIREEDHLQYAESVTINGQTSRYNQLINWASRPWISGIDTGEDGTTGPYGSRWYGYSSPDTNADADRAFHFDAQNGVLTGKLGQLAVTKHVADYTPPAARAAPEYYQMYVTLNDAPLPVGTVYTVGGQERTVTSAGYIEIAHGETALIPNILSGTAFTVSEAAGSSEGYLVTYEVENAVEENNITIADGVVSGVIRPREEGVPCVEVVVNNAECGTALRIPVVKTLTNPDGRQRTFRFLLTQVTDATGETAVDGGTEQELPLTYTAGDLETDARKNGYFSLTYADVDIDSFPATYYYRVIEEPEESGAVICDEAVYVFEVTVKRQDDSLAADVTGVWKDGAALADSDPAAFVNTVASYVLPETGGPGVHLYTAGGLLLSAAALILLYSQSKRGKEEHVSS